MIRHRPLARVFIYVLISVFLITVATLACSTPGSASTTTTIEFGGTSGMCLSAKAAPQVLVAKCDGSAAQAWVRTSAGRFKLAGTHEWLTIAGGGVALGTFAEAPSWFYTGRYLIADNEFLTWCLGSNPMPTVSPAEDPVCQVWFLT